MCEFPTIPYKPTRLLMHSPDSYSECFCLGGFSGYSVCKLVRISDCFISFLLLCSSIEQISTIGATHATCLHAIRLAPVGLCFLVSLSATLNAILRRPAALGLVLFEWVQTVLTTHDAFHCFVYNWGDADAHNDVSLVWLSAFFHLAETSHNYASLGFPLMSSLISCSVQLFFAWQTETLGRAHWLPG